MGTAALDATSDLRRPYLCALRDVHVQSVLKVSLMPAGQYQEV